MLSPWNVRSILYFLSTWSCTKIKNSQNICRIAVPFMSLTFQPWPQALSKIRVRRFEDALVSALDEVVELLWACIDEHSTCVECMCARYVVAGGLLNILRLVQSYMFQGWGRGQEAGTVWRKHHWRESYRKKVRMVEHGASATQKRDRGRHCDQKSHTHGQLRPAS